MFACDACGFNLADTTTECPKCGHRYRSELAAVLSLILPGVGQICNGELLKGFLLFLLVPLLYILIIPGLIAHYLTIRDAYRLGR